MAFNHRSKRSFRLFVCSCLMINRWVFVAEKSTIVIYKLFILFTLKKNNARDTLCKVKIWVTCLTFVGNTVLRNFFPVVRTNPHELVPVPARKQSKCKYCQYLVLVLKTRKEAPVPRRNSHGYNTIFLTRTSLQSSFWCPIP